MPGTIVMFIDSKEVARCRYNTKNDRMSIISFFNLLYAPKEYCLLIQPDTCTEGETAAQIEKIGNIFEYRRAFGIHSHDTDSNYSLSL